MHLSKHNVHKVLAHSYFVNFLFFLVGIYLDFIFPVPGGKFLGSSIVMSIGVAILFLATALILWAQKTSRNLRKENLSKETFYRGPYRFTRGPTHLGIFLLMIGFGLVAKAFFVLLLTLVSFFVSRFTFLEKEEKILEEKYGQAYKEYKKFVRF